MCPRHWSDCRSVLLCFPEAGCQELGHFQRVPMMAPSMYALLFYWRAEADNCIRGRGRRQAWHHRGASRGGAQGETRLGVEQGMIEVDEGDKRLALERNLEDDSPVAREHGFNDANNTVTVASGCGDAPHLLASGFASRE